MFSHFTSCSLSVGGDAGIDVREALKLELRLVLAGGSLLHLDVLNSLLVGLGLLRLGHSLGLLFLNTNDDGCCNEQHLQFHRRERIYQRCPGGQFHRSNWR